MEDFYETCSSAGMSRLADQMHLLFAVVHFLEPHSRCYYCSRAAAIYEKYSPSARILFFLCCRAFLSETYVGGRTSLTNIFAHRGNLEERGGRKTTKKAFNAHSKHSTRGQVLLADVCVRCSEAGVGFAGPTVVTGFVHKLLTNYDMKESVF